MTMLLRLDGSALLALIEADPQFKLDLQRAVVAEIVKKTFLSDFKEALTKLAPQVMADLVKAIGEDEGVRTEIKERMGDTVKSVRAGTNSYQITKSLPQETKDLIRKEVSDLIRAEVLAAQLTVHAQVEATRKQLEKDWAEKAEKQIRGVVEHDVAIRINKGVEARLTEVLALASSQATTA